MSAITRWFAGVGEERRSRVMEKHGQLAEINKTLSEYAELLEDVSTDRAELLKTISQLQIKNAELSVGKALFTDLENELSEIRAAADEACEAIETNRTLKRELDALRIERDTLKIENASLKGQLTKLRNRGAEE